jgi:type IV pilus assembly protein PilM
LSVLDWRHSLKISSAAVLGLDIGSSEVKIVQLRKHGHSYSVVAAGAAVIEDGEKNDGKNQPQTLRAVSRCLETAGAQTQFAVCGVCGPEVAVRCFKFPSLPPNEVQGAALLEAAQVCPFNIDDSSVDYQLIPNGDGSARGVLVAATNEVIKAKKKLAKDASLKCVLMDVEGLALLNCHEGFGNGTKKHQHAATTAILNVGNSCTTLAILGDNGLPFIRDINYAGKNIVDQIAGDCSMSVQDVRDSLVGNKKPPQNEEQFQGSFARACERLIGDVTETLRYYMAQEKSAPVEKILVCGGFALAKRFVELLDGGSAYRAELWNPLEKAQAQADSRCAEILATKGPAMAVAAGLAMRSI